MLTSWYQVKWDDDDDCFHCDPWISPAVRTIVQMIRYTHANECFERCIGDADYA